MSVIDKQAMSLPIMLYIVGWVFFVYLFVQLFNYGPAEQNNLLVSGLAFINFGIHEVSHLVVFFLPTLIVAARAHLVKSHFPRLSWRSLSEQSHTSLLSLPPCGRC